MILMHKNVIFFLFTEELGDGSITHRKTPLSKCAFVTRSLYVKKKSGIMKKKTLEVNSVCNTLSHF